MKAVTIKKFELYKKRQTIYYKDFNGKIYEFLPFKGPNSSNKVEKIYILDGKFIKTTSKNFVNSVLFCQKCYLKVEEKCRKEYRAICRKLNINYKKIESYEILFSIDSFDKNLVLKQFKNKFKDELENINNGEIFILEKN